MIGEQEEIKGLNKKWQEVNLVRNVDKLFEEANENIMKLYVILLKGLADKGVIKQTETGEFIKSVLVILDSMKWTCFFIGAEYGYAGKIPYSENDFSKPTGNFLTDDTKRLIRFSLNEPFETVWSLYTKWAKVYAPTERETDDYRTKIAGFISDAAFMCYALGLFEGNTRFKKGITLYSSTLTNQPEKKRGFLSKIFGKS